jgi:hypothetical protein
MSAISRCVTFPLGGLKHMETESTYDLGPHTALIKDHWKRGTEARIAVCVELRDVREIIKHGRWITWVDEMGLFDVSTAEKLIAIGGNVVLANPAHAQNLPEAWTVLYELSHVSEKRLLQAITGGTVNPKTSRKEAKALRHEDEDLHGQGLEKPTRARKDARTASLRAEQEKAELVHRAYIQVHARLRKVKPDHLSAEQVKEWKATFTSIKADLREFVEVQLKRAAVVAAPAPVRRSRVDAFDLNSLPRPIGAVH